MKYTFAHKLFNSFENFQINKVDGRSYFIPFQSIEQMNKTNYLTERYNSDMITMLNGEWQFKYYDKLSKLRDLDTDATTFDTVRVPSCWQFTGYEEPFYVNQRYQFPVRPPRVPKDCSVGVYRKTIKLSSINRLELLTFLGVCSNLELYINGQFVGYSEGSHNTAEFNITEYLKVGDNEIICLVYKFCNGSYIEAQDMFRNNGIFRDVYMTHYGAVAVRDITISTCYISNDEYKICIASDIDGKDFTIKYTIKDGDKELKSKTFTNASNYFVNMQGIKEWSAEIPNLYTLVVELYQNDKLVMATRRDFGCKHIEIKGNVYYLNNQPIKFKGVNHHDTNQSTGYYMSVDDYIQDAELMKKLNVNSVRTSHYPPDPIFLMIAEHYGLYIVDEADIEAHGVCIVGKPNLISNNIKWKAHYWDRVQRMYERDKNSVAVTLWSLGNEAGGWKCQDYCYDMLKALTDIPIHYEGVIRCPRFSYDVVSGMYHTIGDYENYVAGKASPKYYLKPYLQCEYAHAMGVGPGSLNDYWELFYQRDSIMGGMIWEWADHAVLHTNDKYKYKYTYGGDHGEFVHDSNFCVDGLVFPDRTPHTGAMEMKNVYRTIRAKMENNQIVLRNTDYFRATDYIDINYRVIENGITTDRAKIDAVIKPQSSVTFDIPKFNKDKDTYLIIEYTVNGEEVGHDQFALNSLVERRNLANLTLFSDTDKLCTATANGTSITFDKQTGFLMSIKDKDGAEFVQSKAQRADNLVGLVPAIYRAHIDNYMYRVKVWRKQGLNKTIPELAEFNLIGGYQVSTTHTIKVKRKALFNINSIYSFSADGELKVDTTITALKNGSYDLPKFGMSLEMPKQFEHLEYYGLGELENYSDLKTHALMGIHKDNAHNMLQRYIRPQDSGNRGDVRYAKVTDSTGKGLMFIADGTAFNFNCVDTTTDNIEASEHLEDLRVKDANTVSIDGFVRGIGSNSCGPDTLDKFKLILNKNEKFQFSFVIKTIK